MMNATRPTTLKTLTAPPPPGPCTPLSPSRTTSLLVLIHWLVKVISGLNKFDADLVAKVARAAAAGGGTHIDIACDPELVRVAKAVSNVPVSLLFVSLSAPRSCFSRRRRAAP